MEDMARLAVVEQSLRDVDKFHKILYELLRLINHILENPHDSELRTLKSDILKDYLKCKAFNEYLEYVGFQSDGTEVSYPKEQTLNNLRMAQAAIERKISFCYGSPSKQNIVKATRNHRIKTFTSAKILKTNNSLLLKIEKLFNDVLVYEDEELLALARDQIPLVTLQLMALDRVREVQKKIKAGQKDTLDLPFDIALLMELLGWFKHKFFKWVDQPDCEGCGGRTTFSTNYTMNMERETCKVEAYNCASCGVGAQFPRYNSPRTLLRTRRGRCGEWANCFALLCRALGYDTRFVYDTTDHVWCEIYDYDSNSWLHADPCEAKLNAPLLYSHGWGKKLSYVIAVSRDDIQDTLPNSFVPPVMLIYDYDSNSWLHADPCEAKLNAPLLYSHGWGKKLSYVIAVSRDDIQDVTWKYTMDHQEVLKRRTECSEEDLIACMLALREHRQRQVSEARRRYLAKRTLQELCSLMVEKKPTDYENHGRISGSEQWRIERGETGTQASRSFEMNNPGRYTISYFSTSDLYRVQHQNEEMDAKNEEVETILSWSAGVYHAENVFRKVEHDWKQVYLCRKESAGLGVMTWRVRAGAGLVLRHVRLRANTQLYGRGALSWSLQYDQQPAEPAPFDRQALLSGVTLERACRSLVIRVELSDGKGRVAWQHAQLFRASLGSTAPGLTLTVQVGSQD